MAMTEMRMDEFLNELSSKAAVPGGGGASGYAAALGMALGTMVANLTTGKKKYAEYQEEIEDIIGKSQILTGELAEFMDKDAESFEPLSKAYGLPKDTEEQIQEKDRIMEAALLDASKTPLELMEKIYESMLILQRLSVVGRSLAISDVGVGIQMAKAALNGAYLNVFINTKLMKNTDVARDFNAKADELLDKGNKLADQVYAAVVDRIRS